MAITHVASAAGATSNPTLTDAVTYSSSIVAGDIILVWVHNRYADQDVNLSSVADNDTGGNALAEHADSPSANLRLSLWWKIATSATASKVATATLDAEGAILIGYSAYRSDAGGFDADSIAHLVFENNASGNETQAGFTPDAADSLIGLAVAPMNNVAVASQGADAPDTLSERFDKASSAAEDHQLSYASGLQSGGPTATGTFTWTMTNAESDSAVHELKEAAGDTSATVTPGAIARSFTIPASTQKGGATIAPAATARSFAVNAATAAGKAVVAPAATARSFTVDAVVVKGSAVTAPAATTTAIVIPQVTAGQADTPATVTPDPIAGVFALLASTQVGGAVVSLGANSYAIVIPQATPSSPISVAPAAIATTVTLPLVTISGGTVVEAGMDIAVTMPTPTLQGGAVVLVDSADLSVVASQVEIIIGAPDTTDKFIDKVWAS
jgi:hypothetical protein